MDNVVHFEIPADNVERAKKFYGEIFGWKAIPMGMGYTIVQTAATGKDGMLKKPGAINGGMMKREEPLKHPVITINVSDINKSLKMIENAGGNIIRGRMEVGDMGYTAYFMDPEGNIMGLWQNRIK